MLWKTKSNFWSAALQNRLPTAAYFFIQQHKQQKALLSLRLLTKIRAPIYICKIEFWRMINFHLAACPLRRPKDIGSSSSFPPGGRERWRRRRTGGSGGRARTTDGEHQQPGRHLSLQINSHLHNFCSVCLWALRRTRILCRRRRHRREQFIIECNRRSWIWPGSPGESKEQGAKTML
jgi:hypothetical protein